MTDEQIIKYWNEIDSEIINEHGEEFDVYITMPVAKSTVDLINRQKAEVERLTAKILVKDNVNYYNTAQLRIAREELRTAKSEAIKEFAERLKKSIYVRENGFDVSDIILLTRIDNSIDNLVKEKTEVEQDV